MSNRPDGIGSLKEGQKYCPKCGQDKDLSEFYDQKYRNGQQSWCKECIRAAVREHQRKNPERIKAQRHARYQANQEKRETPEYKEKHRLQSRKWRKENPERHLESILYQMYRLTLEEYKNLLHEQENQCAVCHLDFSCYKQRPAVDHDHKCCSGTKSCGKCVRGLLCQACNASLGVLESEKHEQLYAYLETWKEKTKCQKDSHL